MLFCSFQMRVLHFYGKHSFKGALVICILVSSLLVLLPIFLLKSSSLIDW